jgi:hypothetical protein
MTMRILIFPLAALAFATPALAQGVAPAEVAGMLDSPIVQDKVADTVSDAVSAVLDTRVGAMERVVNPFSGARRSDTLRDKIERDDPYFEDRIHRNTRRATAAAGVMASEFATMLPELRARLAAVKHRMRNLDGTGVGPAPRAYDERLRDDRRYDDEPAAPPADSYEDDWDN